MRTKVMAIPFSLALVFGASACSDDTKDSARETLDSAREDAEDAAASASSAVDDAAATASSAVDDAAATASSAVDDVADDAVELAARNLASAQGEDEFAANGIDVDGDLRCEATATGDRSALQISCTGTSTDGSALTLEGMTSEMPGASLTELEGTFTGAADGSEVFAVDNLGG